MSPFEFLAAMSQMRHEACSWQSWWCAPAQARALTAPTAAVTSLSTRDSLASALDVDDEDDILLHELVRRLERCLPYHLQAQPSQGACSWRNCTMSRSSWQSRLQQTRRNVFMCWTANWCSSQNSYAAMLHTTGGQ